MNLTVAELAHAVERSETYVRQHIYRKHLVTRKEGRRVYVELAEARRWARQRGLPFSPPTRTSVSVAAMKNRTARMTVLAWEDKSGAVHNLFTLLRHRRPDALGPWAKEPLSRWSVDELAAGLRLFVLDAHLEHCEPIVEDILRSAKLEIKGLEIRYDLEAFPRRHWAYRDRRVPFKESLVSPFLRHSAEIREYWSFAAEPPGGWRKALASLGPDVRARFARLGFPLDRRSDRLGNLMIARAEDAIACDLVPNRNGTLSLVVDADELSARTHRATVWASHSGDEVLRREIGISQRESAIQLESDIDRVGFAIWRLADGQCVDRMVFDEYSEVSIRLSLDTGHSVRVRDRARQTSYRVGTPQLMSTVSVRTDQDSAELDKSIRRKWLDHRLREREALARRRGDLVRFGPGKWQEAAGHFLDILRQDCDTRRPVYFADPYFMHSLGERHEIELCLKMFVATSDAALRILCGKKGGEQLPEWWSDCPRSMRSRVGVRRNPGFHDRCLVTPEREILITHSINRWDDGVTFVKLQYGVYRAEAEKLWNTGVPISENPGAPQGEEGS